MQAMLPMHDGVADFVGCMGGVLGCDVKSSMLLAVGAQCMKSVHAGEWAVCVAGLGC